MKNNQNKNKTTPREEKQQTKQKTGKMNFLRFWKQGS